METIEIPLKLIERLRSARHVVVLTGAGISAESGIPTFRDAQTGLWAQFDPQELATPQAFLRNPRRVWEWYAMRRRKIRAVRPNRGHYALVELERRVPEFTLITQNVDGLHRRAGSERVIELHGNIERVRCFKEGNRVEVWEENGSPPRCSRCGGWLRPDVVWFGERLPIDALEDSVYATYYGDLFLSIGTSSVVEPAASFPYEALRHGIEVVEINPEETPLTRHVTYSLQGPSGEVLPALLQATWPDLKARSDKGSQAVR